jgi:serine/threonine protein phosphatase 1
LFTRSAPQTPAIPNGFRVYAVGDIHGRDDLLSDLLARIDGDCDRDGKVETLVIFLGDLIDRGPESRQVIDRLRAYRPTKGRAIFLAGNHEEVLIRLLNGQDELVEDWLRFGGAECLASYGYDADDLRRLSLPEAGATIRGLIPPEHVQFLRDMADTFRIGDYLFVHAGIRPGYPLSAQSQSDLRWIRRPFLADRSDHGFVVVHGHTISEQVDEQVNRIGIDTGAYQTGVLTALALEGERRWLLQTGQANNRSE